MTTTISVMSVKKANRVLNNLFSLDRPLTAAEKTVGRQAALFLAEYRRKKAEKAQKELLFMEIEHLESLGFSKKEALEELRLNNRAHQESIGLGKSRRCRFILMN